MIATQEQTGGGPFWVHEGDESQSLQLVETAQIDMHEPEQQAIASASRYANSTDLVLGLRDYRGQKYRLMQFRNPETGFISHKFLDGRPLRALELPGLWNGAMAQWNSLFVEVPASTFNPVKTIEDLVVGRYRGV